MRPACRLRCPFSCRFIALSLRSTATSTGTGLAYYVYSLMLSVCCQFCCFGSDHLAVGNSWLRLKNLLGQEAAFNLGRAYQQLNLMHLAVPYYEHALRLTNAQNHRTESRGSIGGAPPRATARTVGLEREAAYNLFLIYRSHKGSERLAREILRRHLTI